MKMQESMMSSTYEKNGAVDSRTACSCCDNLPEKWEFGRSPSCVPRTFPTAGTPYKNDGLAKCSKILSTWEQPQLSSEIGDLYGGLLGTCFEEYICVLPREEDMSRVTMLNL